MKKNPLKWNRLKLNQNKNWKNQQIMTTKK